MLPNSVCLCENTNLLTWNKDKVKDEDIIFL